MNSDDYRINLRDTYCVGTFMKIREYFYICPWRLKHYRCINVCAWQLRLWRERAGRRLITGSVVSISVFGRAAPDGQASVCLAATMPTAHVCVCVNGWRVKLQNALTVKTLYMCSAFATIFNDIMSLSLLSQFFFSSQTNACTVFCHFLLFGAKKQLLWLDIIVYNRVDIIDPSLGK